MRSTPIRLLILVSAATAALAGGAQALVQPASELPPGPNRDKVVRFCVSCHSAGMVTANRRSPADWAEVITRMKAKGLQGTPQDHQAILTYLNAALGKTASPTTPPKPLAAVAAAAAGSPAKPAGTPNARSGGSQDNQWPTYGQNNANQNFSPLTQITPANVARLKPAWTFHYGAGQSMLGDAGINYRFEVQPLLIGGVMYITTPASPRVKTLKATITALVPETGKVLWTYQSPYNINGRGPGYWPGDGKLGPRLIYGTEQGYLVALDIRTGRPAAGFGERGFVDAYKGVVSEKVGESRRDTWSIPNPVSVWKNLVFTGARPGEAGPPQPRGDIRAWDARTGKLVWSFHTIPWPGEPYHDTYKGDEWKDRSGANVWSTMTVDDARGILFAPVGDINGRAEGAELFSSSLLALDAATGRLKWFQQITHKDLWDWDLPTPPVLIDVKRDGRTIPAVVQSTKQGLLFIFERETGRPMFGMEERKTPRSDDPADQAWPTQPFPIKPPPIARHTMTRDEIPNLTPEQHAYCQAFWDQNRIVNHGLYTRPMLANGTLNFPSDTGGSNWGGASYNPSTGLYVVNVQNVPTFRAAGQTSQIFHLPPGARPPGAKDERGFVQSGFQYRLDADTVLPCSPTPWGELVAVDTNTGDIAWRKPLGVTEALGEKGLQTGARNLGGNVQTASGLIFIGASNDRRLRAFEAATGKELWSTVMEGNGLGAPMTFMGKNGKQYVVIVSPGGAAVGSRRVSDTLQAYALP